MDSYRHYSLAWRHRWCSSDIIYVQSRRLLHLLIKEGTRDVPQAKSEHHAFLAETSQGWLKRSDERNWLQVPCWYRLGVPARFIVAPLLRVQTKDGFYYLKTGLPNPRKINGFLLNTNAMWWLLYSQLLNGEGPGPLKKDKLIALHSGYRHENGCSLLMLRSQCWVIVPLSMNNQVILASVSWWMHLFDNLPRQPVEKLISPPTLMLVKYCVSAWRTMREKSLQ